jgi:hypothetical protein
MKYILPLVMLMLLACNTKKPEIYAAPPGSKLFNIKLKDTLGYLTMAVPERYDTAFTWVHYLDCCNERKYRLQSRNKSVVMEDGDIWLGQEPAHMEHINIKHPDFLSDPINWNDTALLSGARSTQASLRDKAIYDDLLIVPKPAHLWDSIAIIGGRPWVLSLDRLGEIPSYGYHLTARTHIHLFFIIVDAAVSHSQKDTIGIGRFVTEMLPIIYTLRIGPEPIPGIDTLVPAKLKSDGTPILSPMRAEMPHDH